MAKRRRWTVVFVPHGSEPSRIVEVSYGLIKMAVGRSGAGRRRGAARGLRHGGAHRGSVADQPACSRRTPGCRRRSASCTAASPRSSDTLTRISQRDAKIRVLANLDPIDPSGSGRRHRRTRRWRLVRCCRAKGRRSATLAGDPGRPQRTDPARQPAGLVVRGGQGQPGQPFAAPGGHAVDHADPRLAHERLLRPCASIPILHIARPHEGIDVTAPMGSPIEAPAAGVVTDAGWEIGLRQHRHDRPRLRHRDQVRPRLQAAGEDRPARLPRNQRIALVGNTGLATGPHLHYEVHVNGRPVDPLKYVLPDRVVTD